MLIHSASQVVTVSGAPQRGARLGTLNIVNNGAVLFRDGIILAVGDSDEMQKKYSQEENFSADHCAILPGLIDPHTHLVWSGDRAEEFEMRLEGKSYMEIMAAGGGIQSTVNATRGKAKGALYNETLLRARSIFRHGTTTAEAKSGYGLDLDTECKQLEVVMELNQTGPLEIAPTFLGAHMIPRDFKDKPQQYVALVCKKILPEVKTWWHEKYPSHPLPFVDVFCEDGAFNLEQSRQILKSAADLGYPLKVHADEFKNLGGTALAVEMGAVSADHLVKTSKEDIEALAASNTVAVSLPCTPFGLAEAEYSPVREMINAGCTIAIASDMNPGTAWCGNMQFVMALACRYMNMTPAQALAAATINAAAAIKREDKVGSIEPGKQADMIILSVPDYRQISYRFAINQVNTIIKKGVIHNWK